MIKITNRVLIDYAILSRQGIKSADAMTKWCEDTIPKWMDMEQKRRKRWWVQYAETWGLYYYFLKEEDAVLFKLTWQEYVRNNG